VKNSSDQSANNRLALGPVDRHRDSAHCVVPSEEFVRRRAAPRL